ncbi:MAG: CvpA family protein [Planctomycetota bacterium]|nr:CvpA family protein [Planctomycetota bacterium]
MMNIVVIGIVLVMAYAAVTRNFFSSLLHMACVVVAGAIAFAFWEPLSYLILTKAPTKGFLQPIEYTAWAFGLVLPFAGSLALLRLATDKLAPANAVAVPAADVVGSGVCGIISGVITAGILVTAIGTMRLKTDEFGYQPVTYQGAGASVERSGGLLIPVDRLVGTLYARTSEAVFSTKEPLAKWRPDPWHAAEVMRMNDRGLARNTAKPNDYELLARYRVTAAPGENLLQDRWATAPHAATMLNGEPYPADSRIEGVILDMKSSLREPGASFVSVTAGQIWMIAEDEDTGDRLTLHPIAVIANPLGADTSLARFLYDSPNIAIASAGAATRPMGFEFLVPNDYEPIAVYLKNIRRMLDPSQPADEYNSVAARDRAVTQGTLIEGAEAIPADYGRDTTNANNNRQNNSNETEAQAKGIFFRNTLPRPLVIQKGTQRGLEIDADNYILNGHAQWKPEQLRIRIGEKALRINKFSTTSGVAMVQVDVSGNFPGSLYGKAMATALRVVPPQLVDTKGIVYEAVGWVYEDRDKIDIRFEPGQPVRGLSQLADEGIVLSSSRTDQRLTLLFLCSEGAEIKSYNIGPKEIVTLDEPLVLKKRRR